MSVEKSKAILKKLHKEMENGNAGAIDEAFSPNLVHHWSDGKPRVKNFAEVKAMFSTGLGKSGPVVDDVMGEGDRVAEWWTLGDIHACMIYRFSGGKIVESWNMVSIQRRGEPGHF